MDNEKSNLPADVLAVIPPGEAILWVGRPDWRALAWHAFGLKLIALYLCILIVLRFVRGVSSESFQTFFETLLPYLISSVLASIFFTVLAYVQAKNTNYVITDKRIVIKNGVALIFLLNAPFKRILSVDRQILRFSFGNISFTTESKKRIPFTSCWPSVRPWSFANPKPAFRCIAQVALVESLIANTAEKTTNIEKELSKCEEGSVRV